MGKSKSSNFSQKLIQFVKNSDTFGTPVSLTFKNNPQLKSVLGGFFTMLARIGVAIFFLIQCVDVINKQNTIQTSLLKRDLTTDTTETKLTLDNFDFGVRLEYVYFESYPEIQETLDQYVHLQISQNVYKWVVDDDGVSVFNKVRINTELGSCTHGRLGIVEGKDDYLSLETGYQCPSAVDYTMKGSYSGEESKFIQIRVNSCNQTYLNEKYNSLKQCKSEAEIYDVASNLKLYFVMQNSYFDSADFSGNPIKTFLKPYFITTKNQTSFVYYMALSQNKVTYNDNIIYGTAALAEFIETRVDYQVTQEVVTPESSPNAFIAINVMMDDGYKIIDRKVKTLVDVLQATGGFMTVIFVLIMLIISRLQKTIYDTSLIKSLYKYQKTKPEPGNESMFSDDDAKEKKPQAAKVEHSESLFSANDKHREQKETIYERIIDQIKHRKKLIYGLTPSIVSLIKKCTCKRMTKRQAYKEILFKRGQEKIQKELDIRHIAKQLKTLKFMAKIMLTKYQRFMIEYFKENLLNNKNEKETKPTKKEHAKFMMKYLLKTVENCTFGKIDARMLKNIDYAEDNEILEQLTKAIPQRNKAQSENTFSKDRSFNSGMKGHQRGKQSSVKLSTFQGRTDNTNIDDVLIKQSQKSITMMDDNEDEKLDDKSVWNTGRTFKDTSAIFDNSTKTQKQKVPSTVQGKLKGKNKAPTMSRIKYI